MRAGYYEPSGSFSAVGLITCLGLGTACGLVLGGLYGYLAIYNPFIYVTFLATLGVGFGAGLTGTVGIRVGKVRAPLLAGLMGIFVGAAAVYGSWVTWIHGMTEPNLWIFSPPAMFALLKEAAAQGVWTFQGSTPTGAVLYSLWGVEALILICIPAYLCFNGSQAFFCDRCDAWTEDLYEDYPVGHAEDIQSLVRELENGNIGALAGLPAATSNTFTAVTLSTCNNCDQIGFLTVKNITVKHDKKGKEEKKERNLLQGLVLESATLEAARNLPTPGDVTESADASESEAAPLS